MIKKIVSQRGIEFELGQVVYSNTEWATVTKIEYVPGEKDDHNSEYVATLQNGDWVAVRNPTEVWYAPDVVPDTGA